ncbi:MAG: cobalamin-dependent protein [Spirochaetes bacterium]|nr:cobalamin-dependent protein [Spirochaetota bacterium]
MLSDTRHSPEKKPQILLSSVFGPYARDDEYGSREINPMELFHNQVTRVQGPFSLRMFHPSLGLKLIMENINSPCTILDFPDLDRFIEELKSRSYDIIGISSIYPNIGKVEKMCALIREYQPHAAIVVGGHIANVPGISDRIDADHIVKGEGVRWFRKFLGEDEDAPIRHPAALSAFGARILGIPLPGRRGDVAAILIPSVGCPMGCNFCATSHMFGGKGKSVNFFETGDELYSILCDLEKNLKARSFFVMDENFMLHKKRALRLLELMVQNNKIWTFSIFSSARVMGSYTDEQLVRFGISWVWMGLEGENSRYSKLDGIDTRSLVRHLQSLGIRVLGSTIIGLEEHSPENIPAAIDWAISHNTVFHQFMLYTPVAGTPLHEEHRKKGTLLSEDECPAADAHGQFRFNFRHPNFSNQQETDLLLAAFNRDFETNGPSLLRLIRTMFSGWKNLKNHPDKHVRKRLRHECLLLKTSYAGALWAIKRWYRYDPRMFKEASDVLNEMYAEFGWKTVIAARIMGLFAFLCMKREHKKLARGWTYEPTTRYEDNAARLALQLKQQRASASSLVYDVLQPLAHVKAEAIKY